MLGERKVVVKTCPACLFARRNKRQKFKAVTLGGREGSNENVVVVGLSGVAAEEVALGL
jgi:hypothetical protein